MTSRRPTLNGSLRTLTLVMAATRRLVLSGLLLMAIACLAGCQRGGEAEGSEILIGHFASMSGAQATFGQSTDNGVKMAVEEFNAAGGLNGRPVKLITYDNKGDASEAGNAVTRLVTRDGVKAVIGEVASGLSLAGGPVCQENGVPMISPSSTNVAVTEIGDKISRVCFIDPFQGYVCAKFARESDRLGVDAAAVLYDQSAPYARGLTEEFEKAFTSMGGRIVSRQSYTAGDQDYSAQLTAIRGASPGVLFVPGYYTDVANIAIQARKLDVTIPLLGGDGWDSNKLAEIAGPAIEGCFYSNHYSPEDPSERIQQFIAKYKSKFGATPDALAALGYDSAMVLFEAMKRAPGLDGDALAREIAATKDFPGVTGSITIDAQRNAVKPAVILEMKGGVPRYVATIEPLR